MKKNRNFSLKWVSALVLALGLVSLVATGTVHAEKRKVRKEQKEKTKPDAVAPEAKLQSFGTCRESEFYTKPISRKYHFLELLSDGKGRVVLRDRLVEAKALVDGALPSSTEPGTYSDQSYTYSAAGSNWADELPMPMAMFGRECSAQYTSSGRDFFEVTKLTHPTSGPVKMPGSGDDGKVDYALTTVQDHTHVRVNYTCRMDLAANPLRCEKPEGPRDARGGTRREGKKFLDPEGPEGPETLPGGGGNSVDSAKVDGAH